MRSIGPETFVNSGYTPPSFYERELARGTQIVNMDTNGNVICGQDGVRRIATFGLCGCTAVASVLERADGQRRGYIQHYSFRNEDVGVQALAEELRANAQGIRVARLLVMTPGRMGPSGRFPLEPTNGTLANTLALTGSTYLGEQADVQIYAYEEAQKFGATDQGTLMIELPSEGVANIVADGRLIRPVA